MGGQQRERATCPGNQTCTLSLPTAYRRADRPTSERAYPVAVPSLVSSPFHPHPQARAELGRAELAAVCLAG